MRLPARFVSLPRVGRSLGRRPLAVVLALVGVTAALGMGTGFSDGPAEPSGPTEVARTWSATAALIAEPRRGGAAYYDRISRDLVRAGDVAGFLPLYREAERVHAVNWRLIASIHRQETAFSKAPSTYHGLNPFGCCAGPMQFNVINGPVSTWERYRRAFRAGRRPARYPHRTRAHPSIYDDFDAIMAAGSLLSSSGAGRSLDLGAWQAAYGYYGHDLFGITYASQVLARAVAWERDGFCPNCEPDEGLVAKFEDDYGRAARRELVGSEPPRKKHKRKKHRRTKRAREKKSERRDRKGREADRAPRRPPAPRRRPSTRPPAKEGRPAKPPPPPAQPSPAPPTTPPPPATDCPPIRQLLGGCRPSAPPRAGAP